MARIPARTSAPDQAPAKLSPRGSQRARVLSIMMATIVAATGVVVALNVLGERFRLRADVTLAGDQGLAPRTRQLLASLDAPYRVVIAADPRTLDARARTNVADVLREMERADRNFTWTFIDVTSADGVTKYRELLRSLVNRDSELLRTQSAAIELASGGATSLSMYLTDTLSPSLLQLREAVPPVDERSRGLRQALEQAAAAARLRSRDLQTAVTSSAEALRTTLGDIPMPATDQAAGALMRAMDPALEQMAILARDLDRLAVGDLRDTPAAELARTLGPDIQRRRDQSAVVLDSLRRLKRPDLLRVADVLRSGQAALIIGPPDAGLAAIDLEALYPPTSWLDATRTLQADLSRRAEELIASAIASLRAPLKPIVVLVHAEQRALLGDMPLFEQLNRRLRLRGIDLVEWPVLFSPDPPSLTDIDPQRQRPVVYASFTPDTTTGGGEGGTPGVQRAQRLGAALTRLADERRNLLVGMNPSVLPGMGDVDPTVAILDRFGLAAETGRPLVTERVTAQGRLVESDRVAMADDSTHPLAGAVRGLPTFLPWPIALTARPAPQGVRLSMVPLYSVAAQDGVWLESQWMRLRQTPREQRAVMPDPPTFDPQRDGRWPEGRDTTQPQRWLIAAAVERSELGQPAQRAVVVGSGAWYIDPVTTRQTLADGRPVPANPGNLELFESAVFWLANQDTFIAQSPSARAVAIVSRANERELLYLRIAAIGGLPLLMLVLGGAYRLIRG